MGSGAGNFLKVLLKNFDVLAGYASVRAIESESRADDRQWLTYWVLYSMTTLLELTFAKLIEWPTSPGVAVMVTYTMMMATGIDPYSYSSSCISWYHPEETSCCE